MSSYEKTKAFSDRKLDELRNAVSRFSTRNVIIVTCGSYARREASEQSDIDYYTIAKEALPSNKELWSEKMPWLPEIGEAISTVVPIVPAENGPFATLTQFKEMLQNVGGNLDSNESITRRMLFLLEGEALLDPTGFSKLRRNLLERYIPTTVKDGQITLFLLNDIIRYYRTMTVDYEYKTIEDGKPWAIRNIKLVFSRKLLYASGLFSVGATAKMSRSEKIKKLESLFSLPAIERMKVVCENQNIEKLLSLYDNFLLKIENPDVRKTLKNLAAEERSNPIFRELKEDGGRFTEELVVVFRKTFPNDHPIRRAILF